MIRLVPTGLALLALLVITPSPAAAEGLSPEQLGALREVTAARISPDGTLVAYTLRAPRLPGEDEDGPAWSELHVAPTTGGPSRPYVHGAVNVSDPRFTPDGRRITYLARRGEDEQTALWSIPVGGGESQRLIAFDESIRAYRVSPDGTQVAFIAAEPERESRGEARDKGFDAEVYEEDFRHRRVWIATLPDPDVPDPTPWKKREKVEPRGLELPGSAFELRWSPDGLRLAVTLAPRPLVDDSYMLRRVHVVEAETGEVLARIENPGKLGAFEFSPDGTRLAMISAADPGDPRPGRLMVAPAAGGELKDLLPGLEGHVSALAWQDESTLMFLSDEGVMTALGEVEVSSGERKDHYLGGQPDVIEMVPDGSRRLLGGNPVLTSMSLSADGRRAAFVGSAADFPPEVLVMTHGDHGPRRVTESNHWLAEVSLGRQEVVRHPARDGLQLEGILIHPVGPIPEKGAPLVLVVHGGPEGHLRNGWVTSYSRLGQMAAARGLAAFYPNYRGSTGRGVAFSKLGQSDAAGKEFDDLLDAVDHLVSLGVADPERVGVTGGSYGGYATAWLATRYTERIKAGVMFVGISNKISKGFTTDIPLEDMMVHTLFDPWTNWQFSLERSPLYLAERCRTPLLIAGGTGDSRVHPSQSLQFYRALKMIGRTPVRYVRYPGEPHGNLRATSRYDYSLRALRWLEHYLTGPGGDPPPWDLRLGEEEDGEGEGSAE
jgi:dipeptidyl aminopeptidase/acylaminoacyl peptidase